jgi:hypothetical protein
MIIYILGHIFIFYNVSQSVDIIKTGTYAHLVPEHSNSLGRFYWRITKQDGLGITLKICSGELLV